MIADVKEGIGLYGPAGYALRSLFTLYRKTLRHVMPGLGQARFGGVTVGEKKRWGDALLTRHFPFAGLGDIPLWEGGLVAAIGQHVRPGDRVVVVGTGSGVTAVHTARAVGATGTVTCFEGSLGSLAETRATLALNELPVAIGLRHAIVARNIGVYGATGGAETVSPADLPECDVLQLDCEGSEIEIIRGLVHRPRCILVETHGFLGAATMAVERLLVDRGYRVARGGLAEPRLPEFCEARDIMVLIGQA